MRRWLWLLPLLVVAVVFAIRVTGPPDFLDKDQPRPIDYIVDAAADGHWIVQRDAGGGISSKPPLYTWLAAGTSLAFGGNRFALYLPCGLAIAALVLIAYAQTRRRLGLPAALAAAMVLALAIDAQKAIALARTDAVFAACVAIAAWLALRAWERGRDWWLFWVVCAVVSIAKSPAGVLFAAGGLLAAWWGRREAGPLQRPGVWRSHAVGVALFLVIAGGWFALAVATLGQPVIDRMIGRELVGHIVANDKGSPLWRTFWQPPVYFFALLMPWAIATGSAIWRLVRHPPAAPRRRRFLRFMVCWLGVGLAALCLAPHKRMILSLPMLLPAAVLAGSEIARVFGRWPLRRQVPAWLLVACVVAMGLAVYHHALRNERGDRIIESRAVLATAQSLELWRHRGATIGWCRRLPSVQRYFLPAWPRAVDADEVAAWLQAPGPGVLAVPTGMLPELQVRREPVVPGVELLIDDAAGQLIQ